MSLTIDERLRLELERTALRKIARTLPDSDDWQRAVRIMNRANQRRMLAKDSYVRDREARIDAERRRLIDAAGSPGRHLVPRWAAADRFDPARTQEQAGRNVRLRHENLLGSINRAEVALLRPLVQEAQSQLRAGLPGVFELNARPGPDQNRTGPTRG